MSNCRFLFPLLMAMASPLAGRAEQTRLFDARTLDGWGFAEGEQQWWTVNDAAITGGSLTEQVPRNTFLATKESFQNFDLTLKIRIRGAGGFANSGIQIRSMRDRDGGMKGYQVDAGDGWWGKLYDEHRRNQVIAEAANLKAINAAIRPNDWNEYRILAEGPRIRSWINGVAAIDYTESDPDIPLDGQIGIQVHGGAKALVQVKDVTIRRLPPTPGATTWAKTLSQPLSPNEESKAFTVPDGFKVELVAAESAGIGKFVAVVFDAQGRLWTMTAMEYPFDANEDPARSRDLFERGGIDKVLVIDQPFGKTVAPPRVFADGLVMPLGLLPYQDGAYVQYGPDIRLYRDTNGDGSADTHQVVLTGFGTQDSHLFPHQFTRVPGGWILTAQGLFNYSTVQRPNGQPFANGQHQIPFNQCKLARFNHDGSGFELLTAGPNNIWGLTISREGETWIQEANDMGYPIIPYEPGGCYATASPEKLKSYQPLMPPPLVTPQMGGTGLSGLALADDLESPFSMNGSNGEKTFYIANPITNSIQVILAIPDGHRYAYQKRPDFLVSQDPRFRPVSLQFGPDGCLYITDWYNKIISHNEVPRNHPERDKIRGRIWRIRHHSQPYSAATNLRALASADLLNQLGSPKARLAEQAWQEIVDRNAVELAPRLQSMVANKVLPVDRRLGALWALEGIAPVPTSLLESLSADSNANVRHEAIRIAAAQPRPTAEFLAVAAGLHNDLSPRVRAAFGDALRRVPDCTPELVERMLRLGRPALLGNSWAAYDRDFERFLARWAMEQNSAAVAEFLASARGRRLPVEQRVLATLAIADHQSAVTLAQLIPELTRPLAPNELRLLVDHSDQPEVSAAITGLLNSSSSRDSTLQMLLELRTSLDMRQLKPSVSAAMQEMWRHAESDAQRQQVFRITGAFRLTDMDRDIAAFANSTETTEPMKLAALQCLREISSRESEVLESIATSAAEPSPVRRAALEVLAEAPSDSVAKKLVGMLVDLNYEQRNTIIERMATSRAGASALLRAVDSGDIDPQDLTPETLRSIRSLLPDDELLETLWSEVFVHVPRVLRLTGGNADFVLTPISLSGPFTVETWIRLGAGVTNADGILGRAGVMDMNFHDGTLRVAIGGVGDIVIANQSVAAGTWNHVAVSRDEKGALRIYLNGELSAESGQPSTATFTNLCIGRTSPADAGTDAELTEYRIWNAARTLQQIRNNFDHCFAGDDRPEGLTHYFGGADWGTLSGHADIVPALDAPTLLTAEQATQRAEMFDKYRALAKPGGDLAAGKALFTKHCLVCHKQGTTGGKIGPPLDGIGLTGTEALLRNILTPSAAMEGGYRQFRVLTFSGRVHQGLLVSEDSSAVVLRQPEMADKRIDKSDIQSASFTATSVMPDRLLDDLSDQDVIDLFSYLLSLKPASDEDRLQAGHE